MAALVANLVSEARAWAESLTPDEVEREIAIGDIVLVDLREPHERHTHGAIRGALQASGSLLESDPVPRSRSRLGEPDPTARTILYSTSGGLSAFACASLTALGFTDVAHLDGGFTAWVEAGKQAERV